LNANKVTILKIDCNVFTLTELTHYCK